jgi:methyl-accepting chemotaxis protein
VTFTEESLNILVPTLREQNELLQIVVGYLSDIRHILCNIADSIDNITKSVDNFAKSVDNFAKSVDSFAKSVDSLQDVLFNREDAAT